MSLTHSTTRVTPAGVVVWNGRYDKAVYANWTRVRQTGSRLADYYEFYPPTPDPRELGIRMGEILVSFRQGYQNCGGAYMHGASMRQFTQEPLCFASLNGLIVHKSQLPAGWEAAVKDKGQWEALVRRMLMPVGLALKDLRTPITADQPMDEPVIVSRGPFTMTNDGPSNISIGDPIYARLTDPTMPVTARNERVNSLRTKRMFVPTPGDGSSSKTARWAQGMFKADAGPDAAPVALDRNSEFLLTRLEDYCRNVLAGHLVEEAVTTGGKAVDVAIKETMEKLAEPKMRRRVQLLACGAKRDGFPDKANDVSRQGVDMLFGALSQAFAEDQLFYLGRAMTAAPRGERFDINLCIGG